MNEYVNKGMRYKTIDRMYNCIGCNMNERTDDVMIKWMVDLVKNARRGHAILTIITLFSAWPWALDKFI